MAFYGLNRYELMGVVGRPPEFKMMQYGGMLRFSVKTIERVKAGNKQHKDEEVWHQVKVWGKLAEAIDKSGRLVAGVQVWVAGKVCIDEYDDKEGKKQRFFHCKAADVRVLDARDSDIAAAGSGSGGNGGNKPPASPGSDKPAPGKSSPAPGGNKAPPPQRGPNAPARQPGSTGDPW